jgi:hypothetical protein
MPTWDIQYTAGTYHKRVDVLAKELVIQSKSLDYISKTGKEKNKLLSAIPAIQPVNEI